MKQIVLLSVLTTILLSNSDCSKKNTNTGKYKARLEIAGICMNYTIRVIEGNMDTARIVPDWTDESNNTSYTNVFKLGNPCDFPASIKQGDEFYFIIDTAKPKDCIVCMAYYPTPPKSLSIKVVE